MVFWISFGTWLYQFLIFAAFLTFMFQSAVKPQSKPPVAGGGGSHFDELQRVLGRRKAPQPTSVSVSLSKYLPLESEISKAI